MGITLTDTPYNHTTFGAIKPPKHYCNTCGHKSNDNVCDCFKRHVDPDYNKCFYHTHYVPISAEFAKPEQKEKDDKVA